MTSAPIIRDHPGALVTALAADWLLKSVGRLHAERPLMADVVLTLLAIAAAGGFIALGAWFV